MPRLLKLLAGRAANLLNSSEVGKRPRLEHKTVRSYTTLLETVFLVKTLPARRPSIGDRESTTRKVYIVDSGLLAHLLGADPTRLGEDERVTGMALENFVAMEVVKHLKWASTDADSRRRPDRPPRRSAVGGADQLSLGMTGTPWLHQLATTVVGM